MLVRVLKTKSNKNEDEYGRAEYKKLACELGSIVVFKQLDNEICKSKMANNGYEVYSKFFFLNFF